MDDEPQIMTGEQVADLLQVSPPTIEDWRQTNAGPRSGGWASTSAICAVIVYLKARTEPE